MTPTLAERIRGWNFTVERNETTITDGAPDAIERARGGRFEPLAPQERTIYAGAIVRGSAFGQQIAPFAEAVELGLDALAERAKAGQVSWSSMPAIDLVGMFAAMGGGVSESMLGVAAQCLPSVRTSREDRMLMYYWNRAFAALALDVPSIYRPTAGFDRKGPVPFQPGATYELNMQGVLGHFAGAVEHGADLSACRAAWHETLELYPTLAQARAVDEASLVWMAWVLHHRVAGNSIDTVADFLHESAHQVAGVTLADHVRGWNLALELHEAMTEDARIAIGRAPRGDLKPVARQERTIYAGAMVHGAAFSRQIAPLAEAVELALTGLANRAQAEQVSGDFMSVIDLAGVFAAMGGGISESALGVAAQCLPSVRTSLEDPCPTAHWNRGFAALALDVPSIYRPTADLDNSGAVPFGPGATFELDVQGVLGHFAGAVEHGGDLAGCLAAWHETLALYPTFAQRRQLDEASLMWMAWVLHHRVAGHPVDTVADFLRDSAHRVAGVAP